ncbi:uncharacterized protein LOC109721052 [Ananas comosus]|uniref:Uncharacterized protein LOC109721052 n=1 Tax=Ananas comosus TaxID=4615 RepID=A0A199V9E0_ANACO|nr:uncharacterized protein LOC109721052 [Ananas comosus]OAY73643.1 hypothetical protein ACMD2_21191 [Ananas comosus]
MALQSFLQLFLTSQFVDCSRVVDARLKKSPVAAKIRTVSYEGFQMPLHYPRCKKEDYMKMEEWRLDLLLREYGLVFDGSLEEKRDYAMGAFLWPDQL